MTVELPSLGHKSIKVSVLLSQESLALGEANCHVVRVLKQSYGDADIARKFSMRGSHFERESFSLSEAFFD